MNLHLLRMFAAVVECNGFSRAATALFVTQSAVSRGVRELERQLDLPLVERDSPAAGRRGIRLTDAGQALYEHARGIFALERAAIEEVRARVSLRRGRLRIGASTTIAGYWLPGPIARFAAEAPGIDIALVVGNTGQTCRRLVDCEVDVAFVEGPVDDVRVEVAHWATEPLGLVEGVSADGAAPGGLSARPWVVREAGSGTRQASDDLLARLGIAPSRLVELGSNEAIAAAVAAGAGIALLPVVTTAPLVAAGRLRPVPLPEADTPSRPLYRLELRGRPRSPALAAFLGLAAVEEPA